MTKNGFPQLLFSSALLSLTLSSCGGSSEAVKKDTGPVELKAAGATLPHMAYKKWIEQYKQENKRLTIIYEATGSADGIKKLKEGAVDFAATDVPLSDQELQSFTIKPLHFPMLVGAVVPVFNVPSVKTDLKLTGEILADIYIGRIREWNDPDIVELNPGVNLPPSRIIPIHRDGPSGTTFLFTGFLASMSKRWNFGQGMDVDWPHGQEVSSNEAMAEKVKNTPNSLGYVELSYALEANLAIAPVRNQAKRFQKASLQGLAMATDSVKMPDDFRISLANGEGSEAYPMVTYTWILVPTKIADSAKRIALKDFLRWAYEKGQPLAMDLEYGTVPQPVAEKATAQLRQVQQ
jgi:phosphate transport system substrate-binding protein